MQMKRPATRGPLCWIGALLQRLAEREGFEPPVRFRTTDFESAAIDHSATSPVIERVDFIRFGKLALSQPADLAVTKIIHRTLRTTPPVAVSGRGVTLTDREGKTYIDASGGGAGARLRPGPPGNPAAGHAPNRKQAPPP